MTPTPEELEKLSYPDDALRRKDGGKVSVELRFDGPNSAPDIKIVNEGAVDTLKAAVRRHVRQFRVPCMKVGEPPVVIRQDFIFVPNDGRKVVATTPNDAADEGRREQMNCLVQTRRVKLPYYPGAALESGIQGNILVRMRFTSPDQPPEMQVLAGTRKGFLRESVREFVQGYRLPCLRDPELSMDRLFSFRIDGGRRTVLKDVSMQGFLRAVKGPMPPGYFDLDTMACPFDLRIAYQQPHSPNEVGELDGPIEARKPFLAWLSRLTLNLSEATNTEVLGDQFTLTVPCGKVDL